MLKIYFYYKLQSKSFSTTSKLYVDINKSESYRDSNNTSPNSGEVTPRASSPVSDSGCSTPNAETWEDAKEIKAKLDLIDKENVISKLKNKENLTNEESIAYKSLKEEYSSVFEDQSIDKAIKEIRRDNMSELKKFNMINEFDSMNIKRDRELEKEPEEFISNKKIKNDETKSDSSETNKNTASEDNRSGFSKLLYGSVTDPSKSNINFVLEKQSLEMPDITEGDGGGD